MRFLKEAFDIIEKNIDDSDFETKIDENKISEAQRILGITFPPSYWKFINNYGSGGIGSLEVYGLIKNSPVLSHGIPNVVWITKDEREKYNLPHEYIIIGSSGFGPWYVIDTSVKDSEGESPVLMYGGGYATEKLADSFGEFLYNELKSAVDSEGL